MRVRPISLALALLAGALILAPPRARAEQGDTKEKKALKLEPGKGAAVKAELTKDDPQDKVRAGSHAKTYTVELKAGKSYQIDMVSQEGNPRKFDPYLRLEDPDGMEVAKDDDSGGNFNARITYTAEKAGTYKIVATTFVAGMTGKYLLKVREASAADAALGKLKQQFQQQQQALIKEFGQATTEAAKEKIQASFLKAMAEHVERLAQFAEKHADDPAGRQAAMELMPYLQQPGAAQSPAVARVMRGLLAKAPPEKKAQLALALGQALRNQSEAAYQKKDKAGSEKLAKEAAEVLEQAIKDGGPAAQQAKDALYLLQHLAVGKKAPEIEAEDLDGVKFKLSDYRGKVVVLDFWGNW
jgi:hypothetical protein